jgi:hypothetical protein
MVQITTPSGASSGHGGTQGGIVSGASQGAAAGAMIGGPVGAVIGGVIGGIAGGLAGKKADEAQRRLNQALAWQKLGKEREAAIARRDMVRQFRMQRAMSLIGISSEEGGTRSSAPRGAVAAIGSQYANAEAFMEGQIYIQRQYSRNMERAGKASSIAEQGFGMISAVTSLASTYGSMKGASSKGAYDYSAYRSGTYTPTSATEAYNPQFTMGNYSMPQPSFSGG